MFVRFAHLFVLTSIGTRADAPPAEQAVTTTTLRVAVQFAQLLVLIIGKIASVQSVSLSAHTPSKTANVQYVPLFANTLGKTVNVLSAQKSVTTIL